MSRINWVHVFIFLVYTTWVWLVFAICWTTSSHSLTICRFMLMKKVSYIAWVNAVPIVRVDTHFFKSTMRTVSHRNIVILPLYDIFGHIIILLQTLLHCLKVECVLAIVHIKLVYLYNCLSIRRKVIISYHSWRLYQGWNRGTSDHAIVRNGANSRDLVILRTSEVNIQRSLLLLRISNSRSSGVNLTSAAIGVATILLQLLVLLEELLVAEHTLKHLLLLNLRLI